MTSPSTVGFFRPGEGRRRCLQAGRPISPCGCWSGRFRARDAPASHTDTAHVGALGHLAVVLRPQRTSARMGHWRMRFVCFVVLLSPNPRSLGVEASSGWAAGVAAGSGGGAWCCQVTPVVFMRGVALTSCQADALAWVTLTC